jgi:hypothetical protein
VIKTQRRAVQLLDERFAVPEAAREELQPALQVLARHFQIQSDSAGLARETPPETRLRAELAPAGPDLTLRLVAAPLGPDGPRLPPAAGRARVLAALGGETLGSRRDLNAERGHLESLLAALPFLEDPDQQGSASGD